MKRILFAAALIAATAPSLATDVGVSISIGQPGFYGRIDVGDYPQRGSSTGSQKWSSG